MRRKKEWKKPRRYATINFTRNRGGAKAWPLVKGVYIMQEETRSIGYICPACGKPVLEEKSLFVLSAGQSRVACECGKSALELETDGRKFRLWVPCGLCGKTHTAECDASALLKGSGIGLSCTEQGQLCCYIGERYAVERAMENLAVMAVKSKQAAELPEEEKELFLDSVIMHEVLAELKDIAARPGGITCACGCGEYSLSVRHAAVDIACADCGAKLRIPAATDEDLDRLCCQMKLRIPGRR